MSDKIVELVNSWYAFEKENPKAELQDFFKSYLTNTIDNNQPAEKFTEENPKGKVLGRALNRLSKISIFYSRKFLYELELKNLEDFVYLKNLSDLGSMTKKDLIDLHIGEYSSGIEIIKRLIRLGLVKEQIDLNDKRSTRITITAKGNKTLERCYPQMLQIGKLVFDPLTDREVDQLAKILTKLDTIHTNVYKSYKDAPIQELQKIIKAIGD